jgi:hypothetical protein
VMSGSSGGTEGEESLSLAHLEAHDADGGPLRVEPEVVASSQRQNPQLIGKGRDIGAARHAGHALRPVVACVRPRSPEGKKGREVDSVGLAAREKGLLMHALVSPIQ